MKKEMNYYRPNQDREPNILLAILPYLVIAAAVIGSFYAFIQNYPF